MIDVAGLKQLLEKATPGEWQIYEQPIKDGPDAVVELARLVAGTPEMGTVLPMLTTEAGLSQGVTGCGIRAMDNARLIVAAVNALPEMLAELEASRAEIAELIVMGARERVELNATVERFRYALARIADASPTDSIGMKRLQDEARKELGDE